MWSTRFRIPLQSISSSILNEPSEPDQKRNSSVDDCRKGHLSALFGSSDFPGAALKPSISAKDLDESYARQNSNLARNVAYLSKQIQSLQQENGSLRHRLSLFENTSHSQQKKMKLGEYAMENVRLIRNELRKILAHLEEAKQHIEKDYN